MFESAVFISPTKSVAEEKKPIFQLESSISRSLLRGDRTSRTPSPFLKRRPSASRDRRDQSADRQKRAVDQLGASDRHQRVADRGIDRGDRGLESSISRSLLRGDRTSRTPSQFLRGRSSGAVC